MAATVQFADTGFWFARHVASDRHHHAAREIKPAARVMTTELVLGETWALVDKRVHHSAAVACVRVYCGWICRSAPVNVHHVFVGVHHTGMTVGTIIGRRR